MTTLSIQPPFPLITDIDGQPLEDGYIWIGTANLPPIGNPIAVYWDAALTIPAALPIRTRGGYPVNAGTPARLYVGSDYSILVQNKNGSTLYSAPDGASDRFSAAQISFLQAGLGAVATTVQAKLRETVSVKDFGAVGNGVADDTAAIQNAINYVVGLNDNRPAIYLPAGTYKVSANLTIGTNAASRGIRLFGDGTRGKSTIAATSAVTKVLEFLAAAPASRHENVQLENFTIDCASGSTQYGVYAPYSAHGTYRSIRVRYSTTAAMDIGYAFCSVFDDIELVNNTGDGLVLTRSGGQANQVILTSCKLYANTGFGLRARDSYGIGIYTSLFEGNDAGGLYFEANIQGFVISGSYFEQNATTGFNFNSPAAVNIKTDILINGAGTNTTIANAFPCTGVIQGCFTSPSASQTHFVYAPGQSGLKIDNNRLLDGFVGSLTLVGLYGSATTSPSFGAPNGLDIGYNIGFTSNISYSPITAGVIQIASNTSIDAVRYALVPNVDQHNIADVSLNEWAQVVASGGGTWKRSATVFTANPQVPVWELEMAGAGSSDVYGFTLNCADYPQFHNKLVCFAVWCKTSTGGSTMGVVPWANSTAFGASEDATADWRLKIGVFTFPTTGTRIFGIRKIVGGGSVYVASPVLTELGSNIQALLGEFALQREFQGGAAPIVGTWSRGDIVWNRSPSAGGDPGWMCVTAGAPGTWKAMAALAP